ncbi:MAG: HAD family hydrolase [Acidobacteriaceae bacterium]|nr:HAD family hydrolase [Acidobacteriaceae bacterium]
MELQVIFNKDAVMILPPGVNKMTGLCAALDDLKLSRHNVVGIGDAENDHAFLESCECSVAVANAIPALKERATIVTEGARGAGVAETIDRLIATDLSDVDITSPRRCITIGSLDQNEITIPCYGPNLLICGQSGSGKSTFVTGLVEQIVQKRYQVCLIDPEGDYEGLENYRTVGDEKHAPSPAEVMQILQDPDANVVVNLIAVPAGDRPNSFISFVTALEELRLRTGRPHWLFIDEAHHVLPSEWGLAPSAITEQLNNVVLITVHPGHTSPTVLRKINTVVVVGREPKLLAAEFANVIGANLPDAPDGDLERSEALVWFTDQDHLLFGVKTVPSRSEHHRHKRKYAEGRLEEERMFRFRGPEGKLNLPAHNLSMFVEIAEGIDAETWMFHLKRGDYSRWFRNSVKDSEIADQLEAIEKDASLTDAASRVRVKEAILHKYAAPA